MYFFQQKKGSKSTFLPGVLELSRHRMTPLHVELSFLTLIMIDAQIVGLKVYFWMLNSLWPLEECDRCSTPKHTHTHTHTKLFWFFWASLEVLLLLTGDFNTPESLTGACTLNHEVELRCDWGLFSSGVCWLFLPESGLECSCVCVGIVW